VAGQPFHEQERSANNFRISRGMPHTRRRISEPADGVLDDLFEADALGALQHGGGMLSAEDTQD